MALDYNTLLLAIGLSGLCLAFTLFASWISAQIERFMLSWAVGIGLVVPSVACYSVYVETPGSWLGAISFLLLLGGFSFIYGAAYRYRTGKPGRWHTLTAFLVTGPVTAGAFLGEYDGLGLVILNTAAASLLWATAWEYWKGRAEAPLPITGIAGLYCIVAVSFLNCAAVLAWNGQWVLGHAPDNWAEDLNLVAAVVGITGIGAMSLALNQWRLAGSHRREAMTDALTGLLNRRALFDRYGGEPIGEHTAIVAFDLDRFKAINDRYGHAIGDKVLLAFAEVLSENCRETDCAARFGGEEFALVLHRALPERAMAAAERIRSVFAQRRVVTEIGPIVCSVSAGIAFGSKQGATFDSVLNNADKALYTAKRDGRNRVSVADLRLVG
ncbi:GGDEF domain-containing protein [Sinorhizobium sp. BG8]|uniref:GGDEF domain-containing protein n=1 Tax=Sinorhizobium sp. BG8 TaxID=2613773 RepID=UPI00193CBCC3|nr:GGDEF domain-containing protein [Sinorhizobium sp. BG8]QRM54948.1 GGDEF domain-containing protein [Sinorhizobium sp. BG8]